VAGTFSGGQARRYIESSMLDILFEDNHLLVVSKPAPMLTQAPDGVPSLEALAKEYLRNKHAKSGRVYLGVPHRLDRPVSGVVIFARQTKSAQRLAEQFHSHRVQKVYWAIVAGSVQPAEGVWEDWLRKIRDESRTEVTAEADAGAKHATTRYQTRAPVQGGCVLELKPQTGRMHQLRIQAASRGHPILGDALYGSATAFGPPAELPRDRVIALHAHSITFDHPIRFEPMTVTAPLPDYWPAIV
jgi:23S rRNA pseudouridine1911/1915/1917 synthase